MMADLSSLTVVDEASQKEDEDVYQLAKLSRVNQKATKTLMGSHQLAGNVQETQHL